MKCEKVVIGADGRVDVTLVMEIGRPIPLTVTCKGVEVTEAMGEAVRELAVHVAKAMSLEAAEDKVALAAAEMTDDGAVFAVRLGIEGSEKPVTVAKLAMRFEKDKPGQLVMWPDLRSALVQVTASAMASARSDMRAALVGC